MTRLTAFLLPLLYSLNVFASGLQASFGSPNLNSLVRPTTRACWDGSVDASGNLLDVSGLARHLAPVHAPTTGISTLQRPDGNKWLARTFDGANDYYWLADAAWMDISSADHTITMVLKSNAATSVFGHIQADSKAGWAVSNSYTVAYFKGDTTTQSAAGPTNTTTDTRYHVLQVVCSGRIAKVAVDGAFGTPVNITGYGLDGTGTLYLGGPTSAFNGDILYTRLDAEALTEERLAYEKDYLLGIAARSGTADIGWNFSRASAATFEFSDGSISYSAAMNISRVSGSGGGVLAEGQRANLALQSQTLAATWTSVNLTTLSADGTTAPDGTATADGFVADATDGAHGIFQAITLTAVNYTVSAYAKIGNKNWIYVSDDTVANGYSYFNASSCTVGTKGAGASVATATPFGNGWCRCSIVVLGTAAPHTIRLASADSDTDNTFAGDTATVNTWFWGAQVELGSFPSTYIPTVASTVIRYQDNLTMLPIKLGKDLRIPGSTPKLEVDFSQDPLSATLLDNTSTYTFTKGGTVTALDDYTSGRRFVFNGTDSQYVLADAGAIFSPAGNFSVVVVAHPAAIPGTFYYLFGKYTTGDKRSWSIYNNSTGEWTFAVSQGGDSGTTSFVQKTDGVQLGRTALIVATFNCPTPPCAIASGGPGNNYEAKLYVDDTTVVTDSAFYGPAKVNDADMNIGRSGSGSRFTGDLSYVALYDGIVISATEVTALYTKFKQANVLPTGLGTGYVGQKLTIEFEAKCQFASLTDMGADRTMLSIGSTYFTGVAPGGSSLTRNYINIFAESADGKVYADFYSGSSTTRRFMSTAVISTYNKWHKYKVYYDFSNLASSNIWADSVAGTVDATMTAAAHSFNITDLYIRVGQPNNALTTSNTMLGTTDSHCSMRNLRVQPNQF